MKEEQKIFPFVSFDERNACAALLAFLLRNTPEIEEIKFGMLKNEKRKKKEKVCLMPPYICICL
jgi:hypothetical protein